MTASKVKRPEADKAMVLDDDSYKDTVPLEALEARWNNQSLMRRANGSGHSCQRSSHAA